MSLASSGSKVNAFNEENEILYDPYPAYVLGGSCVEPPWPEWSDAELNAETWDEGKLTKISTASSAKLTAATRPLFDDPKPPTLPPAISAYIYSWKRPKEVFRDEESLTLYDPSNVEFFLHIPSEMSSECEFLNVYMEEIKILQYYGFKYGFQVELEGPTFTSTTQGEPWRPWHNVYAMCKAGKGQVHKPLYCPYGKYIVRLYYLGAWRRFVVDDKIPCDIEGNSMLPVTQIPGELWPIILVKALLKILSLTPTNHFYTTDFPFLSLFTGWTVGCFLTTNKSNDQVWERLVCLAPRYRNQFAAKEVKDDEATTGRRAVEKNPFRRDAVKDLVVPDPEKFCFLLARIIAKDLSVDCSVGVIMITERPLADAQRREKPKPWKRIRWIHWAKERGLWAEDSPLSAFRRVLILGFKPQLRQLLYPDSQSEAALQYIPMENESDKKGDDDEPENWCEFLKFLKYAHRVYVYFKPSYFASTFRISCLKPKALESATPIGGKNSPKGKATSKVTIAPQNSFTFPHAVKLSYNEPIFVLCENHSGIFLNFSLTICPLKPKSTLGYLDPQQPKLLKIGHASLIVELHDWRSYEQGEIIGMTKTVGNSSVSLNLRAGRYVMKLWLCTDCPYVIDVYSNATVFCNKSSRIRFLMSNEPQRILNYINNASNTFIAVTLKFGKPDLSNALREFYDNIKPGNDYCIGYYRKLDVFIEAFLNCLLLLLKDLIPNLEELWSMVYALRCLFVNPDLKCDIPQKAPPAPLSANEMRQIHRLQNYPWTDAEIEKIVTIQRFFRGYRIRLLWKCQTPARKEFKVFSERLKKICDIVFSPAKREPEVGKLLRKIVMKKPELRTTFKFHEDFINILQVEEFTGKIQNVEPFAWVPLARFVIACHSEGNVPCYFFLSSNLERVIIQGFNNDTGEEIFKVTNSISPHYYHSNSRGYTIVAFGWNEAVFKTVNWRLEIVKMKHYPAIHLCDLLMSNVCKPYAMPSLEVLEIKNFYVPNSKAMICRCLIKIQKRALLTLRLSLSYPKIHFELKISLGKGPSYDEPEKGSARSDVSEDKVVLKVVSKNGAVIVPALVLEGVDDADWNGSLDGSSTVYTVEAFVLNKSWPLTKQEWGLVEPLRQNWENWSEASLTSLSKRGQPDSRKKLGRSSKKSITEQKLMDNPLWLLQVLNDTSGAESGEQIVIEEDRSHAAAVRAMKASWREKDPDRAKTGKEMRMKFLYQIFLEERDRRLFGEDSENLQPEGEIEDPQSVLDRLSNLSYLTSDTSTTRYVYSPRILPATPLRELLDKYGKIDAAYEPSSPLTKVYSEEFQTELSFGMSRDTIDEVEEEKRDFSRQFSHYRSVLINHMIEEQRLSNKLMEQAYEERLKALETMTR